MTLSILGQPDEALELEREALHQVRVLRGQLAEGDPYRAILERHLGELEEAVRRLEVLSGRTKS
jgi:hypothetical protein